MGKTRWTTAPLVLLLLMLSLWTTFAVDRGFDGLVREFESRYHARRTGVPFLWLARLITRVSKPEGVSDFRLAVFDEQDLWPAVTSRDLDEVIRQSLDQDWRPLVRVNSLRDHEFSTVFIRERHGKVHLLITSIEPVQAVVVEVSMNQAKFAQMLDEPEGIAGSVDGMGRH